MPDGSFPTLTAVTPVGESQFHPAPPAAGTRSTPMLGHVFSICLGFKGGKAVAARAGVFVGLAAGVGGPPATAYLI